MLHRPYLAGEGKIVVEDRIEDGGVTGYVESIVQVIQVDELKGKCGMRNVCGVGWMLRTVECVP